LSSKIIIFMIVVSTVSSSFFLSFLDESMNLSFIIIIVQDKTLIISEIKKICNKWKLCYYCKLQHSSKIIKECSNKKFFTLHIMNVYDSDIISIDEEILLFVRKSLIFELSHAQRFVYISSCLLVSIFSFSLQSYRKFSAKFILKLFVFNLTFKDNHLIVFCILRQAQFKVLALALIDSEIFVYVFMNKLFMQQHHLLLHQLIHFCRLWEFDDQVALIDDIIHVVEITMILDEYIKKLFFYVIELSQYLIIMSLSWLYHHVIDVNFEHNILILSFLFCLNHCCQFFVKIYDFNQQEENFSLEVNKVAFSQYRSQYAHKKQLSSQIIHKKQFSLQIIHKKQFSLQIIHKKQFSLQIIHKKQFSLQIIHKKQFSIQFAHKK